MTLRYLRMGGGRFPPRPQILRSLRMTKGGVDSLYEAGRRLGGRRSVAQGWMRPGGLAATYLEVKNRGKMG
jgi:hypothetical protein